MKSEKVAISSAFDVSGHADIIEDSEWTTIIDGNRNWGKNSLTEILRYRDLILLLVRRDFVAQYKQTILGPLWFIIQPLFTSIVFTLVFGRIAKIPTDGIPDFLFFLSGTVCWGYFANCLSLTADTFISNAAIFGKIYFPRIVIPISIIISQLIKLFIQIVLFLLFLSLFYVKGMIIEFNLWVLSLPLLILQMALLGMGCGIMISSMTTKYRDLCQVVSFGVQLWMFATPVVYPLSQIPQQYRIFFIFNPMASVIESFRAIFLGTGSITAINIAVGWAITLVLLLVGIVLFNRVEKTFIDTV